MTSKYIEGFGIPWCFREDSKTALKPGHSVIINLDDSPGPGTHWVAARIIDGVLHYADPFGSTLGGYPPSEIAQPRSVVNRVPFQRPKSTLCGYYAIGFALALDLLDQPVSQKDFEELLFNAIR